jgi:YhcH/YjgK/YiaL family protein
MIIDTLKNIETYKGLSIDIYEGLKFILNSTSDIKLGIHRVNKNVKAIVSEYETIENFVRGYEAHRHVIDIQYPIIGMERVKWSPIENMNVNIPYDINKDQTFYLNPSSQGTHVDIGNGVFIIMFAQDGHSPQHYITQPELIKKITVKVSI